MHMKMMTVRESSKDVDCGICYEKTVEKGRRFGLLSIFLFPFIPSSVFMLSFSLGHCDHPFCLECIREWRGGASAPTTTLRSCPICRVTSYYIIPSEGMISDPERKKDIIEQYKVSFFSFSLPFFLSFFFAFSFVY